MPDILIRLHAFEDAERTARVVDDIKNRGEVSYVDAQGATVNVTVGDVSVDDTTTVG